MARRPEWGRPEGDGAGRIGEEGARGPRPVGGRQLQQSQGERCHGEGQGLLLQSSSHCR